ncbi:MAG: alpha/beta hydrolase [Leptospiraceae bacterium]|nr:alpha/beta hydrolase [Leptospiraceae bacterium]
MDWLEAELGTGKYGQRIEVIGKKGIIKKESLHWGKSTIDENGNVVQNGYTNLFDYSIGAIKVNGKLVGNSSIVKIGSDGKMQVVNSDQVENGATIFVNGIMNDHKGALGGLKLVSQEIGKEIYLVYNSTGGAVPDLFHSAAGRLGQNTEASQNVIKKLIESGKVDTILAHSQGSLIVGNALKELVDNKRSKSISNINLATFGSPAGFASIPAGLKSAVFYENTKSDPVAWFGSLGRRLVLKGKPNYMIRNTQNGYFHLLDSGYRDALNDYRRIRNVSD